MPVMFTSSHNSYGRYSLTREISAGILSRTKPKFSASSVQFNRLFKEFGFRFCLAIDYFGFLLKRIITKIIPETQIELIKFQTEIYPKFY